MAINKYQFYVSFNNKPGTASSKAIDDCSAILSSLGYFNLNIATNLSNRFYFFKVAWVLLKLVFIIPKGSVLAVQYPLLTGNFIFRNIITLLHAKQIILLAIVHDLDELRYQSAAVVKRRPEVSILNRYDKLIVHNRKMLDWLKERGITSKMISLEIFDYLAGKQKIRKVSTTSVEKTIVFAGNFEKSIFIYNLNQISEWRFNLYGPNIDCSKLKEKSNLHWHGCLDPEELLSKMEGSFGLIWDGVKLSILDEGYGNYLRFNNPHKLSLYLAAGLPVIVPADAAIATFVRENDIGLVVENLLALNNLEYSQKSYYRFQLNAQRVGKKLKKGYALTKAVSLAETDLKIN